MKTKNYLRILLLSVVFISQTVFAQDDDESSEDYSRFGVYGTGGLNFSRLRENDVTFSTGFNAGIGFAGMLNARGSHVLSLEILYSQQGTKFKNATDPSDLEYVKLNYFNIPLMFRYSPFKSNTNFYIAAGPQIGFGVGGNVLAKDGTEYEFKDGAISSTVFDAVGAIGILAGDSWDFVIELRYQHGLGKILETSPELRSQVLQAKLIVPLSFLSALGGQ